MAVPQVAARMLSCAMWAPTRLDEHAVSTAMAGPVKPKVYAARPGATLAAEPAQQPAFRGQEMVSSGAAVSANARQRVMGKNE